MNAVSVDIKDWLVAKGLGEFAGTSEQQWGIFIGDEPPTPNRTITIFDVVGTQQRAYNHNRPFVNSHFQLRVRGGSYLEARDRIAYIYTLLHRCAGWQVGKIDYNAVLATNDDPLFLTKDSNQRFIWVQDYVAFRQEKP